MTKGRFFRALVCFLVIGCLMFSYIALPSRASALGAIATGAVISGAPALGIAGVLLALGAGIVFTSMAYDTVCALGESMYAFGKAKFAADQEAMEVLNVWIQGVQIDLTGGSGNGSGDDGNKKLLLPPIGSKLYEMIQEWLGGLMRGDGVEVAGEVAPEGYAYYNGVLLPMFHKSGYSQMLLFLSSDGNYKVVKTSGHFFIQSSTSSYNYGALLTQGSYANTDLYQYDGSSFVLEDYWTKTSQVRIEQAGFTLIWHNDPIYDSSKLDNIIFQASSEPTSESTTTVYPSVYVGDQPAQVQNGEKEDKDIEIPPIDYTKLFQGQSDAVVALNQWASQLADGTLTHDDYLTMTQPQNSGDNGSGDNTGTDPGGNSGTDTGTDSDWDPPKDPGMFALDLSKVFPFCIPFDLYAFLACLNAEPVAPVINWEIALPGGGSYPIQIDLSPFNSVAQLLRRLQLLLFILGLAIKTRDLIKG